MAASATKQVQIAVVTALENDVVLFNTHGCTGVFDEAPADQAYPYISIGPKTESPWLFRTFGKREKEVSLVLDIWTDIHDGDTHLDMLDDVNRLFDKPVVPLVLDTYTNTDCYVEMSTTNIDEMMDARHTVCRLLTINT